MLDRQRREYDITYVFSLLSTNITFNSQQSRLDINKVMETVLTGLLNKIFGLSLVNLNKIKHNHPAIDLGDYGTGSAFQVTSDGSREKFEKTIEMFVKHNLQQSFSKITFIIISNDPKISFSRKSFNIEVHNLSDIAKEICVLEDGQFNEIYAYCESNFSVYFPNNNRSMLEPTLRASVDPSSNIGFFLSANDIVVTDEHINCSVDDIKDQLIRLKEKLSEFSNDQRWFIYRVMEWTMNNYKSNFIEYCLTPRAVIERSIDDIDIVKINDIARSLEHLSVARYEEFDRYVQEDAYYVYYNNGIPEEFDYLAGIVIFLRKTEECRNRNDILKKIIIDCDFSCIN
ncbi:hypothetical protein EHW64_17990 [Erwinia psidii]|uniref:SMEK domain-containing protein n=1 Tax=Erwinia psidii TaxID=69224 RepID=UPI00226B98E5|nr:SMEK domain-containing protein [Erwinia psidii]MCX8959318.1 hypothetical protein [Erwinia psidii]MCX8962955.1 hypothetical protein [Erwinia psidii]